MAYPFTDANEEKELEQIAQKQVAIQEQIAEEQEYLPNTGMQSPELTKWRLSTLEILEELEHELRGENYNFTTKQWEQTGEKLLNEKGVRAVVSMVGMVANKVSFLSNLEDRHIYEIVLNLGIDLAELIFINSINFGIDMEKGYQTMIVDKCVIFIFIALRKSFLAGERKSLNEIEKVLRRIDESQPRAKKFGFI